MLTKHFAKILFTFMGMIILGLLGIFIINYFDGEAGSIFSNSVAEVAE